MTASPRSPHAVLALMVGLILSGTASARKPDSEEERDHAKTKGAAYETHKVRKGETLWSVAMDYHTSAGEIMDLNGMDGSRIIAGQTLKIPRKGAEPPAPVTKQKTYTVNDDDTLRGIARRFDVSEDALTRVNPDINPKRLRAGTRLIIPSGKAPTPTPDPAPRNQDGPGTTHVVKDDETFTSIARQHRVSVADVIAANPDVKPERLHEGMKIKIPGKPAASREDGPKPPAKKSTYIVKPGDTLEGIARREGIPAAAIVRANGIANPHVLVLGSTITLPDGREAKEATPERAPAPQDTPRQRPSLQASNSPSQAAKANTAAQRPTQQPTKSSAPTPPPQATAQKNKPAKVQEPSKVKANVAKHEESATTKANANTPRPTQPPAKSPAPATPPQATAQNTKPTKQVEESRPKEKPTVTLHEVPATVVPPVLRPRSREGDGPKAHIVGSGESIDSIAAKHGIPASRLRDYNHLPEGRQLRPGEEVLIPEHSSLATR